MGNPFKGTKAKPAKAYAPAQFQPYSYTSQVGTTTGTQLASIGQSALSSTQPFLDQYFQQAGQEVPMFSYGDTGEQRARDIFAEQSALLQPQFAQQRQQLKSDLFGSGRMGLMLAGETTGAGGGYVQPDAFGLARAQSMSLADLSGQSRERAMLEQQQGYEQALGGYEANTLARQQQLTNYLGGVQAGLGTYGTIGEMEAALVNQGLSIEQARSASQSASASGGAALAQAGTPAKNSLFSDLLVQAASGAASAATTVAMTSDRNLKTNIRKVGELASGLNTYFWDWTEEAKQFVGNQNTFGVIAQEAQLIIRGLHNG